MEDSKANYLLSSENGETDSGGGFFDWPLKFMISKLSGVDYSDKPKKAALVKASERKSLYSARYFRYTVLMFIVYLMIGLGYYSGHAGFTVLDAIYFIIISFYTVGFGDYVALSESQRLFTSFYAIFGFTLLCVIGVTAGDFFHHTMRMQNSVRAKRVLDVISQARFDMKSKDVMQETEGGRTSSVAPGDQTSPRKVPSRRLSLMQPHGQGDIFPSPYSISDPRVIELMRKVNMDMFDEELEAIKYKTNKDFLMILLILFLGSLCMGFIEDWSAIDAMYWACVTITTIGYGDFSPSTSGGKTFTIFYCLLGIGLMAKAVTDLASYPFLMREKKTELEVLMQFGTELSEEQLTMIQSSELINALPKLRKSRDRVEKSEFVLILLQLMDKVQDTDIVYISEIFDALDKNGDGHLSDAELNARKQQARTRAMTALTEKTDDRDSGSSRPNINALRGLFQSSGAEKRRGSAVTNTAVPFTTTTTVVNGPYQPPVAPPRGIHRGSSSPSVLGLFAADSETSRLEEGPVTGSGV